ncbi:MAG: 8-amino-7-oxononanoate synthase [Planctomycetota bacterium]|nr:MAG: 8-amino-7-oxononanoate synthase [Planctomycetota bacterium]
MNPLAWIDDQLHALQRRNLLRRLPAALKSQGAVVQCDGKPLVNFASNDYLGLASDPRLVEAAVNACRTSGVGRGASPLVCGRSTEHEELERRLAALEGTEAALVFPSGFAANAGTVPALAGRGDAIYADAKNHASLIDGCRLSRAETHVYPHADAAALGRMLEQSRGYRRRLIITDTLFSMDGDLAPLREIAALAERYEAMLLVDEAHATGVFGERGRGVAEALGVEGAGVVRVGTMSKALGSAGGFVCGPRPLVEWLVNRARSYVFSTAHPASASAAAMAALEIIVAEPMRRVRLLETAGRVRDRLRAQGWNTGASASQIVPVVVGAAAAAVQLSQRLRERGYWVPAIRPPSVPPGESLLRLSLTASHTAEMIDGLLEALGQCRLPPAT